jgi:hypothetical protein
MTAKKTITTITAIKPKDDLDEKIAKVFSRPEVQAADTIHNWRSHLDDGYMAKELSQQIEKVNNGDMQRPEAMLLSQAHTLDMLFNNLAQRAHGQTQLPQFEGMLRLAFKAQSQCRTTLETLAAIKNPPVIFAKQANISHGHQQINNGVVAPQAEKIINQPNEVLTELTNEAVDSGRKKETIGAYTAVETMGEVIGASNA